MEHIAEGDEAYLFEDCWATVFWTPCHNVEGLVATASPREQRRDSILGQRSLI